MSLAEITILLAVAFALAFLTESLVEYLFGTLFDKVAKLTPLKWALMYVAAGVGVALALYWQIDLIAVIANGVASMAGVEASWKVSVVGEILSGLAIGRGANFLHDFISKALVKPDVMP